jgi:hypothetical protein
MGGGGGGGGGAVLIAYAYGQRQLCNGKLALKILEGHHGMILPLRYWSCQLAKTTVFNFVMRVKILTRFSEILMLRSCQYSINKTSAQAFTLTWKWRHTCYGAIDKNTNREPQTQSVKRWKAKSVAWSSGDVFVIPNETQILLTNTNVIHKCTWSLSMRCRR